MLSVNFIAGALCHLVALIIIFGRGTSGLRVQFFEKENYTGALKNIEVHDDAENECIPVNLETDVRSVKTDKCIMVYYYNTRCMSNFSYNSISIPDFMIVDVNDLLVANGITGKLGKNGVLIYDGSSRFDKDEPKFERRPHPIIFYEFPPFMISPPKYKDFQPILSLSSCSRKFGGGPEVDVDFYSKPYYDGSVAAQYKDVCGCRNVDKIAVGGKSHPISVDNHGNSIDLFEEENCEGQMETLKPGSSFDSKEFMAKEEAKKFDVRSFRPSGFTDCIKLNASIYKMVFKNGTADMMTSALTEEVKIASDTILRANGSASLSQEYSVSEKVTETLDFTIATGFSNMHKTSVQLGYEAEVEAGVPFVSKGKSTWKIGTKYEYDRTDSQTKTNRTSVSNEENVSAKQVINVPACTECVVTSFLKKVKNFPVRYTAYSRVTGYAGGNRMSAREVKENLNKDAVYLGDVDGNTIDVMAEGVMYAEYGMKALINADCIPIPDCVSKKNFEGLVMGEGKPFKISSEFPIVQSE